jgi:hypothetical protein
MYKKILMILAVAVFFAPAYAKDKAGEIVKAKGRVEIVHGDAVMGKRAKAGSDLVIKDIVRTKRRGFAEVGFVDGTAVKVFEKSRLTLNGIERTTDGYNAEIQKGKVLFKVEKMADVAGDFRVKTTNSIIGVKGTTFGVVSGSLVTIVEVFNGTVEVKAVIDTDTASEADVQAAAAEAAAESQGGDADADKATLEGALEDGTITLNSGEGLRLDAAGGIEVFEISAGNSSFSAGDQAVAGQQEESAESEGSGDEGGDDQGEQDGGDVDKKLYDQIGLDEEGDSGMDDIPGAAKGQGDDFANLLKENSPSMEQGGANEFSELPGNQGGDIEDDLEQVQEQVDDANELYTNPDERPETQEQIDQSTGSVNINITFK